MQKQRRDLRKEPCPCGSGQAYAKCCRIFHEGKEPDSALKLMRSRFSAYVYHLATYIIRTTHPASPQYIVDEKMWRKKIAEFSQRTTFNGLEILAVKELENRATITFVAHLGQKGEDATFTETSYFEKVKGKWYYRSGNMVQGKAPHLLTHVEKRLLPLAYYGAPILRRKADPILEITEDVKSLVEEMVDTMDACDGIGLAAPQIHHAIRLFVMREPMEDGEERLACGDVKVFINPEILSKSTQMWTAQEGCLSMPTIHADVSRPKEIEVEYTNLEGQRLKEKCSFWKARVILHENDHIDGVLFIDHLEAKERLSLEPYLEHLYKRVHDGLEL